MLRDIHIDVAERVDVLLQEGRDIHVLELLGIEPLCHVHHRYGVGRSDEDLQIDDVHVPVSVRAGELELLRKGIVLGLQLRVGPLVCGAPLEKTMYWGSFLRIHSIDSLV